MFGMRAPLPRSTLGRRFGFVFPQQTRPTAVIALESRGDLALMAQRNSLEPTT
jgi:hypothetical protein